MRSDMIKVGVDKAPARGLLYATGQVKSSKDMQKPFIAICNSHIDIVPGHVHLRELADIAKELSVKLVVFLLSLILLVWMTGLPWDILGCVTASLHEN